MVTDGKWLSDHWLTHSTQNLEMLSHQKIRNLTICTKEGNFKLCFPKQRNVQKRGTFQFVFSNQSKMMISFCDFLNPSFTTYLSLFRHLALIVIRPWINPRHGVFRNEEVGGTILFVCFNRNQWILVQKWPMTGLINWKDIFMIRCSNQAKLGQQLAELHLHNWRKLWSHSQFFNHALHYLMMN